MGCKMFKFVGEFFIIIIRFFGGCSKILGRYLLLFCLVDGEYVFKNLNIDSYYLVFFMFSIYGFLWLDFLWDYGEELSRIVSSDYFGGVIFENIRDSVNFFIVKDFYFWFWEIDLLLSIFGWNRNNENVEFLKGLNNK